MKIRAVVLVMGVSLPMGTLLGNLGGSLTGDSEEKINRDILSER
jgi:hypothetical protein